MGAFSLIRLKEQIEEFAWQFPHPQEFTRSLRNFLEGYANWGYRAGQVAQAKQAVMAYHVPPLVMRKLEQALIEMCRNNLGVTLLLADVLWQESYLEPRLMAVTIFGQAPLNPPDAVIQRLQDWAKPGEPAPLLEALFNTGSVRLRCQYSDAWIKLLDNWVSNPDAAYRELGLRAILQTVKDENFENLPPVFRILSGLLRDAPDLLHNSLQDVLEALSFRLPTEAAYFFRQQLSSADSKSITSTLIRRTFPYLEPSVREGIRATLFDHDR